MTQFTWFPGFSGYPDTHANNTQLRHLLCYPRRLPCNPVIHQAVGYVLVKANRSQMTVSRDTSAWEQCKELGVWRLGLADMIAERN